LGDARSRRSRKGYWKKEDENFTFPLFQSLSALGGFADVKREGNKKVPSPLGGEGYFGYNGHHARERLTFHGIVIVLREHPASGFFEDA